MKIIRVKERVPAMQAPAMQALGITFYHFSLKHRSVYISELIRQFMVRQTFKKINSKHKLYFVI